MRTWMQFFNGLLLFTLLLPGMRLPALAVLPEAAKSPDSNPQTVITQTYFGDHEFVSNWPSLNNAERTDQRKVEPPVLSAVEELSSKQRVREGYINLPFYFIENRGQHDARVAYYTQQGNTSIYFTPEEVVMVLPAAALRTRFVDASSEARITGHHPQEATFNYFIGRDPKQWHNKLSTYREITYHSLYPGVDLTYTGREGTLKYIFVLQPGAEADGIRLAYAGAEKMRLAENGDLLITPEGTELPLRDTAPYAYQEIDGAQVPVAAAFKLYDDHTYGFTLGAYDPNIPLVIDPTLLYSTLLGGSSSEYGHAITLDDNGNVYVTGEVNSTDFPTTTGAYTTTYQGGTDVFVSVLSADLSTMRYSTFLGGAGTDIGRAIALDAASGDVYVTGDTFSDGFPTTTGAYTTTRPSGGTRTDVFLSVFSADLSTLSYSTFLGGYLDEYGHGIAIDDTGSAYITGYTYSGDFPTTLGAYRTTYLGPASDIFVSVLDPSGNGDSDLLYATYLGGSTPDYGYAIALDDSGSVYVTGNTEADDFPTTVGAYATTRSGSSDAFVSVFTTSLSSLSYSTYLGGSQADISHDLTLDSTGNVYIAGTTESSDFPVTAGAYDKTLNEDHYAQDTFVSVLDPTLSTLSASTFLGGSWIESAHDTAIALDSAGHVYVTGDTASGDFPTTSDAYTTTGQDGTPTVYLSVFSSNLAALSYATFIGAGYSESMAMDDQENVYIMGFTGASEYPTTPNAYMTTIQGGNDVFITKFGPAADLVIDKRILPTTPISPGGAITYTLTFSNTGILTATDVVITDHVPISVSVQSVISSGVAIIGTGANLSYVWDVADLAPNDGGTVTLTGVLSDPLAMGTFTNTATIATDIPESNDFNNRDEARITVPNVAPTADDDTYSTPEETPLHVAAPGVLEGDNDTNGDTLTVTLDIDVTNGSLALATDGAFSYTPTLNFNGAVTFTYHLSDALSNSNSAIVTLTVTPQNDAPVATADVYTTAEDTPLSGNVITDDTGNGEDWDVDDDTLMAVKDSTPTYGTLTLESNGVFIYTPTLNYHGVTTFTYHATDTMSDSNITLVTLTVTAENDPPVATDNFYSTTEQMPLNGNVLTDDTGEGVDSDVDSDTLTAVKDSDPTYGTLKLENDGAFIYTPTLNHTGVFTFTYYANDGAMNSNLATVSITVTASPPACPKPLRGLGIAGPMGTSSKLLYMETPYTFTAVLTPADASPPLVYMWAPDPDKGQSTPNASYTWPAPGSETITLTVQNCNTYHFTATRTIDIAPKTRLYLPLVLRIA